MGHHRLKYLRLKAVVILVGLEKPNHVIRRIYRFYRCLKSTQYIMINVYIQIYRERCFTRCPPTCLTIYRYTIISLPRCVLSIKGLLAQSMKHLISTEQDPRCPQVKEPIVFHVEGFEQCISIYTVYIYSIVLFPNCGCKVRKNGKQTP